MPTPQPKKTRPASWLPTQVAYGMDCSDQDPKNWKPFGYLADELAEKAASAASKPAAKPYPPAQ